MVATPNVPTRNRTSNALIFYMGYENNAIWPLLNQGIYMENCPIFATVIDYNYLVNEAGNSVYRTLDQIFFIECWNYDSDFFVIKHCSHP